MLAKLKIPHYIIDKATFPRDKTCGDGLILYAYKALKELDENLYNNFLKHPKILHSRNIKLNISNDTAINFIETEKERPQVISYAKRIDFDNFLVENLSKTYANQFFGNPARKIEKHKEGIYIKLKNGEKILSKLVIGADGVNSLVAKQLANKIINPKKNSTFITAYFKDVKHLPKDRTAEIRLVYKGVLLFFYIFPLADGQVNVSLVATTHHLQKNNINLIEELEDILNNHPEVSHKFKESTRVSKWRGWSIPFHFGDENVFGDNFMLVGDAAGLANAFYKEGVGTGMMSGIICAKKIEQCIQQNNYSASFLKSYEKDLKKEFYKLLKFSRLTLRIARFKRLFLIIIKLFKKRVEKKAPKMILKRSY